MTYPIVVLVISLAVVFGLLTFVIPKFVEIFEGSNNEIPALTQLVMGMSDFVIAHWYIILGGMFGLFWGIRMLL